MAKTKVELQNYQGESLSPITIASNVLYEDGRNAQEVFEEYSNETFTPTIENSSSMFKVGQGDNVDYSSNVVNGAYESMVLKGKTMVNCIQEPSSQDVVLPYEFEDGQYVTINDTKESGALGVELKGQTLVNLWKKHSTHNISNFILYDDGFMETKPNVRYFDHIQKAHTNMIKPNTKYLLIIEVEKNTLPVAITYQPDARTFFNSATNQPSVLFEPKQIGRATKILTSISDLSSTQEDLRWGAYIQFAQANYASEEQGIVKIRQMLLEYQEGMENWDIPYFEGMTSVKMPILHTVGKNLATVSNVRLERIRSNSGGHPNNIIMKNIPVEEGKTYTISGIGSKSGNMNGISFTRYEHQNPTNSNNHSQLWDEIGRDSTNTTFTIPKGIKYVSFTFGNCVYNNNGEAGWLQWDDIQLEEGSSATTYEPYKSNILTVNEDVTLRGIGNVKDELDCLTGEVTERIGNLQPMQLTFGSPLSINTNTVAYSFEIIPDIKPNQKNTILSNALPQNNATTILSENEGFYTDSKSTLVLVINKSRLTTLDKNGLLKWLTDTSCEIIYLKSSESIKTVDLNVVDQNGSVIPTLKSWNTTTHIYSEIPENSLYPILSHSNPTYPVILKPSTKYSIVANSYSNNHTNSAINFNLGGATASTTVGNRVTTITTPSTLTNEELVMSGRGNKLNNVMVIEGDVAGDLPYFEGICDCKSPILSNVGKNLWNIPSKAFDGKNYTVPSGNGYYGCKIMTLPRGTYFVKATLKNNDIVDDYMYFGITNFSTNNNGNHSFNVFYATDKGYNTNITNGFKIKITSDFQDIYLWSTSRASSSIQRVLNCLDEVHMELTNEEDIVYESYKSNTTTFNRKDDKTIVLRSLPNGVCDTLNVETGEYVQRIGEIVLDGSSDENWNNISYADNIETLTQFGMGADIFNGALPKTANNETVVKNAFIQNMFAVQKMTVWTYQEGEACAIHMPEPTHHNQAIQAKVLRSRLSSQDVAGWRALLQATPWILQYELATPIVSTIDVQGFPYAYTSGHVQLSSGSIEQSLTPKVEYSVATNRNGQIRSNQKMVERHQKQLDQLQAIILANLVNSQYNQTLTTLNYDLLKKEVGE